MQSAARRWREDGFALQVLGCRNFKASFKDIEIKAEEAQLEQC